MRISDWSSDVCSSDLPKGKYGCTRNAICFGAGRFSRKLLQPSNQLGHIVPVRRNVVNHGGAKRLFADKYWGSTQTKPLSQAQAYDLRLQSGQRILTEGRWHLAGALLHDRGDSLNTVKLLFLALDAKALHAFLDGQRSE